MNIHDLPSIDRPREKLAKYGPLKLSSAELLALIVGTGSKGTNVLELARKLLKRYKDSRLTQIDFHELSQVHGVGSRKAAAIVATFELGRRLLKNKQSELLLTPGHVWNALHDIRSLKREHFVVFYLDAKNQSIEREIISIGTLTTTLVHPREVFEPAIKHLAANIIIAHNHPSGTPSPSPEDIAITHQMVAAGTILGIEVLDHVIVTHKGYISLKQQGLIQ